MNRAARRASGRREVKAGAWLHHGHDLLTIPLDVAFELNRREPLDGMAELLYAIRADEGPNVLVHICMRCQTVGVLV